MSEAAAHRNFQYGSAAHQADTAVAGMWLFLATEVLFFGGLFFAWVVARIAHGAGFALATRHTDLAIGSINTALLVTSSLAYALALRAAEAGRRRALETACAFTVALGIAFLVLKGIEWSDDFNQHLFPGPGFGLTGPDSGGAQLFYVFYFVATGLHGVHMLVGVALLAVLMVRAHRGEFDRGWTTPVEVTGLYWSFVDMVWLVLYPLIYVLGRT